jgi:hypothetical protein
MANQQDKYSQMQSKLREGRGILAQSSSDDGYQLGVALLKLHAALEDYYRLEIARKAPSLRMEVDDPKKTSWNELIRYAKQYLRLTEEDARIILEAERSRLSVAQGGDYEGTRQELLKYADFVERRCNQGKPSPSQPRSRPVTILRQPYERILPTSSSQPRSARGGWYRSRLFFLLVFFLAPPLWAILTLTDKEQARWLRLLAGAMLSLELFVVLVLLNPASTLMPEAFSWIRQSTASPAPILTPTPTLEETPQQSTTPMLSTVTPIPATGVTCTLTWAEYPSDRLVGKNRSMVWAEIVLFQVSGSGMSPRQFYDEVLTRNPQLASDGYEFKMGKTYLLPRCE